MLRYKWNMKTDICKNCANQIYYDNSCQSWYHLKTETRSCFGQKISRRVYIFSCAAPAEGYVIIQDEENIRSEKVEHPY